MHLFCIVSGTLNLDDTSEFLFSTVKLLLSNVELMLFTTKLLVLSSTHCCILPRVDRTLFELLTKYGRQPSSLAMGFSVHMYAA